MILRREIPTRPDFRRPENLLTHVRHTLDFYDPRAFDASGGFHQFFKDDGTVFDPSTRHLVSSTRYVYLWSMAARHFPESPQYLHYVQHAVAFLRSVHRVPDTGGYCWQLAWDGRAGHAQDSTQHCYGFAFALLAYAHASLAGMEEAREWIRDITMFMETRFWQPSAGLYADEATADWRLSEYRGQNANMHAVEACLAAYEATGEQWYVERAAVIAESVVQRLASLGDGRIWEHYRADWSVDWDYNRFDRTNIFRPWGYQPGHFAEWARLLLELEQHTALPWLAPRAEHLFEMALQYGWDVQFGGLYYGFAPDGSVCDDRKFHWVQCETLAAAAALARRTGRAGYWDWYERLWDYCWEHWVDHEYGAWYRILARDHSTVTDEKSTAGKVDYHTTGACYAAIRALTP